ncbi:MAG: C4-type zinc ribbon domain-containing protein [Proteobacteria bacterium]|nr:C4-type zinc ribbon domain-containing protein [Pseudomonadota bacterium]
MPESIDAILHISKQDRILLTNKNRLKTIPEKKKLLRIPVRKVEHHLDKLKEKEEEIYGKIRERETLVNVENEKIKKSDEKMLAVKNQKEYMASQKEIDIAKKTIKKVEDQILELEGQKEELSQKLSSALEEYRQEKEAMSEKEQEVLKEEKVLLDIIEECNKNKNEVISKVDPEVFAEYEQLVTRKVIPAAVAISSSNCMGCAMAIPAQLFNEIMRDSVGRCPHCTRLLFYKAPEKPAEDTKKKTKAKSKKK